MSAATLALVGLAGGAGAVARFVVDGAVAARTVSEFPFGTLVVNLTGTFALGVLVGAAVHGDAYRIAGTGALGGYTTFSTWMFESQRLGEDGELGLGALNLAASLVAGVLAIWIGRAL
ncbi:MAG TPA: fluoride efflux transporter CrcB [Thermoleophilaceae bacterium]